MEEKILLRRKTEVEDCALDLAEFLVNRVKERTICDFQLEISLRSDLLKMRFAEYERAVAQYTGNRAGPQIQSPLTLIGEIEHGEAV